MCLSLLPAGGAFQQNDEWRRKLNRLPKFETNLKP